MSVLERDVVLTGKDGGQSTIDFPKSEAKRS